MTEQQQKPRRHSWPHEGDEGYTRFARCDDGNERVQRTCRLCGVFRVTVIPPRGECWHEWRLSNTSESFQMEATPPCLAAREVTAI